MKVLAHGGTAGAAVELLFVLVPVAVFALLARTSRRRREQEDAEAAVAGADEETTPS
ncbi:MAG TPA: hypothetical protein VGV86_08080 [Acidimicrobiales bacterium]|nr:hypothetical protein [Acidimicrobiales bacterium]